MRHISQESFAGDISFCFVFVGWFFFAELYGHVDVINCVAFEAAN